MPHDEPQTTFDIDQHKVGMAVHGLMSSASDLSALARNPNLEPLVRSEYEDIEAAHKHIGRMLERIRGA